MRIVLPRQLPMKNRQKGRLHLRLSIPKNLHRQRWADFKTVGMPPGAASGGFDSYTPLPGIASPHRACLHMPRACLRSMSAHMACCGSNSVPT